METLHEALIRYQDQPDELIISEILKGQKDLFNILMKRYNQRLFRVIRGYLKTEDQVTDVMQNTYLKAYEKLSQFHGDAAFSTWLIRIGINEALLRLRKQKRRWQFLDVWKKDAAADPSRLQIDFMNPEKKTIHEETRRFLEHAIDHLPEKYRVVYMMREVEGLSSAETAQALNLTESNVKVRLFRAKSLLKKTLLNLSSDVDVFEFGDHKCDKLRQEVMKKIREHQ